MQRYHTVLFDADNTLFDFDRAEHEALGRALRERGYPDDDATRETYLAINRELWRRFDLGEADQDWLLVERFRLAELTDWFRACGAEALVLGCTHFPYFKAALAAKIELPLIDPAEEMVRRVI